MLLSLSTLQILYNIDCNWLNSLDVGRLQQSHHVVRISSTLSTVIELKLFHIRIIIKLYLMMTIVLVDVQNKEASASLYSSSNLS